MSSSSRACATLLAALLLLALLPTAVLAAPEPAPGPQGSPDDVAATPATVPGALMVTYADETDPAQMSSLSGASGLASVDVTPLSARSAVVDVTPGAEAEAAVALSAQPGVVAVEPERSYRYTAAPDDPLYADQWAHQATGVEEAWEITTGSRDVRVAVLDAGVDGRHPDLRGNLVEQVDVSTGVVRKRALGSLNATCPSGVGPNHGTAVAGVVGALGDNGVGVAGVAWEVGIVDVALSSIDTAPNPTDSCGATDRAIVAGLQYVQAPDRRVDVVNLSLGGEDDACPSALQAAIDGARGAGIAVVAAAGNNTEPGVAQVPGACNGVISVAATGPDGVVAPYSAQHPTVDVAAPGGRAASGGCDTVTCILTPEPGGDYDAVQGTSFAAPYVAGVIALARTVAPALTPDELESLLEATASHPEEEGRAPSPAYGWGRISAAAVVAVADAGDDIPPPAENPDFPVGDDPDQDRGFLRVAAGDGDTTDPVTHGVETSRIGFDQGDATHAVLARSDVYADALAGSTLAGTTAPILFNASTGGVADDVARELLRVLPAEATVYLLGGESALDASIAEGVKRLGFEPRRLPGNVREGTARLIAQEAARLRAREGLDPVDEVLIANRINWPDAVAAGELGARDRVPVLLAYPDQLDAQTQAALEELAPSTVHVVGGEAVVGEQVAEEAADLAGGAEVSRLGGRSRDETTVAVSEEMERRIADDGGRVREVTVVNLDRADAFAPVLSGSVLAARRDAPFVGIRRSDGSEIPPSTLAYTCGGARFALLSGGRDLLPDRVGETLAERLQVCDDED